MTEQEQQLISDLAERIRNTPVPAVDRDADELIRRTIGTRPDALYVMTQVVLMQQMALNQARNQIEALQQQRPAGGGSFLGSGYAQPEYPPQGYAPPPGYGQPGYAQPGYTQPGGFSSFLHNAVSTAAGVFAGEAVFDSLASLFGHRGGSGFFGGGGGQYFDDSQAGESRFAEVADQNQDISPDIEDDRDVSGGDDFSGDNS
ncbi:MAG TPA: DUF2076 domain-containing protein [Bryobacteraceae bacterium]|jgi:hypothetical protein|nr:DUF2076 domain-containing protein [Bryobacteraceae bacterium]